MPTAQRTNPVAVLTIRRKCKPHYQAIARIEDFQCSYLGETTVEYVLTAADVTLYCLDDAQRAAIFVQTRAGVDLARYPFFFQAQYRHAQLVFVVPYALLFAMADALPAPRATLVLINSVGRCGSTLVSKAFQEVRSATSLAEPDVFTQIVTMRAQDGSRDAELTRLLRAAILLFFKPSFTGTTDLWVLKFRNHCIQVADLMARAFPDARHLVLCRDLRPWLVSHNNAFGALYAGQISRPRTIVAEGILRRLAARQIVSRAVAESTWARAAVRAVLPRNRAVAILHREITAIAASFTPLLAERLNERRGPLSPLEVQAYMWLSAVHRYGTLRRAGLEMQVIRYEDLLREPDETLQRAFRYVGLELPDVPLGLHALARDAQEGTPISRAALQRQIASITDTQWRTIAALLERYPRITNDAPDLAAVSTTVTVDPGTGQQATQQTVSTA